MIEMISLNVFKLILLIIVVSIGEMSSLEGWYTWSYNGGSFPVAFRPYGSFYCPQYIAQASWVINENNQVLIDWGSYGSYSMNIKEDPETKLNTLEGFVQGNPNNWRKATFARPFNPAEQLLFSGGSEWNFEWEKGSFPVEFRADSMNHFICQQFPAHAHWSIEGNVVTIDWDRYGEYEMTVDPTACTMSGCAKGQPTNWRRATFIRNLGATGLASLPAHEHSHKHGENCNH